MRIKIQHSFLCGALAIAGLLAAAAPADAAVYRGRFDPVYGDPFTSPELAWRGSLEVSVPDACIPTSAGNISLLGCGGIQITQAIVEIFDAATPGTFQQMDFGSAAGPAISGLNWELQFDAGAVLTGANSTAFPAIQGAIDASKYLGQQAWFSLQFLGDSAQLYWFQDQPDPLELLALTAQVGSFGGICRQNGVTTGVNTRFGFVIPIGNACGWSDPDNFSKVGAFITFSAVPEPETYALVLAALGAMFLVPALTRRRRGLST